MPAADPRAFLPLKPAELQILLLLAREPLHGYALLKEAERDSAGVSLEVGSLYRILRRLLGQGLVEEQPGDGGALAPGRPRRSYRMTSLGRAVAQAEAERLEQVVSAARAARLLRPRGRA